MDFQQWMIDRNPPTEVRKITGSDHMVMMCKPIELSVHLHDIAKKERAEGKTTTEEPHYYCSNGVPEIGDVHGSSEVGD
ncbi:unnamed protein product [Ilex paraguariensis]|uniref:Uncharacterized protein n=1 Tax=Ilex paraguariensis TaxID=185542 RepID=A0ABC8S7D4_9AQUA